MKRIAFIALSILLSFSAFSQKCKFARNDQDEFTGMRIIETFVINLKPVNMLSFKRCPYLIFLGFTQHGKGLYVCGVLSSLTPYYIEEDNCLYIKFEDDSILKLQTKTGNFALDGTYNPSTGLTAFGVPNLYPATMDNVATFLEKKAVKVRIETSKGYYEEELTKKSSALLMETAKCFLYESRGIVEDDAN
jgi:hypothetical protein|nr:MAG TPA: hypothetical protein [Caudoviricetes sp.]